MAPQGALILYLLCATSFILTFLYGYATSNYSSADADLTYAYYFQAAVNATGYIFFLIINWVFSFKILRFVALFKHMFSVQSEMVVEKMRKRVRLLRIIDICVFSLLILSMIPILS